MGEIFKNYSYKPHVNWRRIPDERDASQSDSGSSYLTMEDFEEDTSDAGSTDLDENSQEGLEVGSSDSEANSERSAEDLLIAGVHNEHTYIWMKTEGQTHVKSRPPGEILSSSHELKGKHTEKTRSDLGPDLEVQRKAECVQGQGTMLKTTYPFPRSGKVMLSKHWKLVTIDWPLTKSQEKIVKNQKTLSNTNNSR